MTRKKKPGIVEQMQPLMLYKYRAGIDPYAMNQDGSSKGAVVLTDKKGEVHHIIDKYTDLAEGKNVTKIPYNPKPFFTKSLRRKLRWRIFKLKVYRFFGLHRRKIT